jgi:hypothetical protein
MTKKTKDENSPVTVYSGFGWEAAMVKHLLENEGIEAFLNNENLSTVAPMYVSPGAWGTVSVVVAFKDMERAKPVVAGYEEKYSKKK